MTRNFKALGLALVAMLALGAVLASAASALTVTAAKYPAAIAGTQTNTNTITNGVRATSCSEASLTGSIAKAAEVLTITPIYGGCTGNGATTITINTNNCTYTLKPTIAHAETTGTGTITVDCPEGTRIVTDIWATGKKHTEPKLCRLEVPAQGPLAGFEYHNTLAGGIELTINLAEVKVLRTEGTAANCGAAEQSHGTYTGNVLATATNEGAPVNLMVG